MPRKREACTNHSEKTTTVRCFKCHAFICKDCQKKYFHHHFCSVRCTVAFIMAQPVSLRLLGYAVLILLMVQTGFFIVFDNHPETIVTASAGNRGLTDSGESIAISLDSVYALTDNVLNLRFPGTRPGILAVMKNDRYIQAHVLTPAGEIKTEIILNHGNNRFELWFLDLNGTGTCLDSFEVIFNNPRFAYLSSPVTRIATDMKRLALTIDGGSAANGADSLIRIITERGLRLTFFLTGIFIQQYPGIVQILVQQGQEIGNHTYTHPHLTTWKQNKTHELLSHVDQNFVQNQLQATDSLLYASTGTHMLPLWRAPFGEYNAEILQWAAMAGYKHIGWTPACDTWDWVSDTTSQLYLSGEQIYQKLMHLEEAGRLKGAIMLMHLNSERENDPLYKILPRILDELISRGYQILSVSELLKSAPNV